MGMDDLILHKKNYDSHLIVVYFVNLYRPMCLGVLFACSQICSRNLQRDVLVQLIHKIFQLFFRFSSCHKDINIVLEKYRFFLYQRINILLLKFSHKNVCVCWSVKCTHSTTSSLKVKF